jgi:hypothetical protein
MVAFGKYRVIKKRSAQGSWIVYDVEEVAQNRKAELRVYSNRLPEGSEREKTFLDTLNQLAEVDHPHVINILDLGVALEKGFYTCPPRQAISLTEAFAERELDILDPCQLLEAAIQLCDGFQALHEKGLVHGAVCSDTISWDQRRLFPFVSWIPILDRSAAELRLSPPPAPKGFEGEAADLYQIAGLIHHLLIGTGPLQSTEITSHTAAVNVPGAMDGLYEILERALCQDPEEAFAHVSELTKGIQKLLSKQRVREELEKSVSSFSIPQEVLEAALKKKKEQKERRRAKEGVPLAEAPHVSPLESLPKGKVAAVGGLFLLMFIAYPLLSPGDTPAPIRRPAPSRRPGIRPAPRKRPRPTRKPRRGTKARGKKPKKGSTAAIKDLRSAAPTSAKNFRERWGTLKSWILSLPPAKRRNLFTYGKLVRLRGLFKSEEFKACNQLDELIKQAVNEID